LSPVRRAACGLGFLLALAGCGGSSPSPSAERQQIRNTVAQFEFDVVQHRWEQVCGLTTQRATCLQYTAGGASAFPSDCGSVAGEMGQVCTEIQQAAFDGTISNVTISGQTATATFSPDGTGAMTLTDQSGHWLISNATLP
jgi:hypothetical protein